MKRLSLLIFAVIAASCGAPKPAADRPLIEVLTSGQEGGATIKFFEILTEEKEIAMLQGDASLSKKITADDIKRSNFVILNLGEKPTAGYSVDVTASETPESIVLTVREKAPTGLSAQVISYPYTVVRVNSKKKIEIRD